MIKYFFIFMIAFSGKTFACKLNGAMAGSGAFIRGMLTKLYDTPKFRSYEVVSIVKNNKLDFDVIIKDSTHNKCLKLEMYPFGTGSSCTFTSSIKSQSSIICK